jgi:hypothetical protein
VYVLFDCPTKTIKQWHVGYRDTEVVAAPERKEEIKDAENYRTW